MPGPERQLTGPSLLTIRQYWVDRLKTSRASTGLVGGTSGSATSTGSAVGAATASAAALGLAWAVGAAKAVMGRRATARTVRNFMVGYGEGCGLWDELVFG